MIKSSYSAELKDATSDKVLEDSIAWM